MVSSQQATTSLDPRLAIIIVNYQGWPDVARLCRTLAAGPEVRSGLCEVIVVDNASDGPIPPEFSNSDLNTRLILRPDNGGFALGVNTGWRATSAPWLLLLNPDVETDPGLPGRILTRIGSFGERPPGLVGFGLLNPNGTPQGSVGVFPGLFRTVWEQFLPRSRRKYQSDWRTEPGPVDWVTGACLLASSQMMSELGGMDEDFFLYYEEVALCHSANQAGWRVEFDPSVQVVHLRPLQNRAISPKMRVITRHSKLLYFRKHTPWLSFLLLSWGVSIEASVRRIWSGWQGQAEQARSWRVVGEIARELRQRSSLAGRQVLARAEAVAMPPG